MNQLFTKATAYMHDQRICTFAILWKTRFLSLGENQNRVHVALTEKIIFSHACRSKGNFHKSNFTYTYIIQCSKIGEIPQKYCRLSAFDQTLIHSNIVNILCSASFQTVEVVFVHLVLSDLVVLINA